ncbi:MAG: hypothetical protein ACRDRR_24190 [Pseudonocardiaceae bacterium]
MLSTTAVKVTTSAKEATATTARITALKGESYATGIHEVLEQIAGRLAQGRSMSAEAIAIRRTALQDAQSGAGRSQAIDRLRAIRRRAHLGADAPLAEQLVRADRERSG